MINYLYPDQEKILNIASSDIFYKNYNTLDYIIGFSCQTQSPLRILQKLPENLSANWQDIGIELDQEYNEQEALVQITKVFEYIYKYDSFFIGTYINILVKSIHLLKTKNEYNDVSFSDPNLPYTIFINLPNVHLKNWLERTVENMIHEAMHLQLSLLEKEYDFYLLTDSKIYSPWKHEPRNNKGILHALYVFSHLKTFWEKVYNVNQAIFAKQRIEDIQKQLNLLNFNQLSSFYTEAGKDILKFCLKSPDGQSACCGQGENFDCK